MVVHIAAIGLILIGIAGIVLSDHLVRVIFGIVILEAGANLLLLLATYREGAAAPIMVGGEFPAAMADPVPQALVLTAIVIGVGILALRVHNTYGTLDIRAVRQRMEQDIAAAAGIDMPTSSEAPAPVYVSEEGRS